MSFPYFQPNIPIGHSQVLRSNGISKFDSHKYSATYACEFHNLWNEINHPFDFPSNAHWSPPVIVAHSNKYRMWETGELASDGVKEVVEVSKCLLLTPATKHSEFRIDACHLSFDDDAGY